MGKTPQWLQKIVNNVQRAWDFVEPAGVLGCRWQSPNKDSAPWVIEVYPTATEILGGRNDGEIYSAAFNLELREVLAMFVEVSSMNWAYPAPVPEIRLSDGDLFGPSVSISGYIGRRQVKLSIYAWAPYRVPATALYNELTGEIRWRA